MTLEYQLVPLATVVLKMFPLLMNKLKSKVPIDVVPVLPDLHWFLDDRCIPLLDFMTAWKKLDFDHANEDGLCSFWIAIGTKLAKPAVAINVAKTAKTFSIPAV